MLSGSSLAWGATPAPEPVVSAPPAAETAPADTVTPDAAPSQTAPSPDAAPADETPDVSAPGQAADAPSTGDVTEPASGTEEPPASEAPPRAGDKDSAPAPQEGSSARAETSDLPGTGDPGTGTGDHLSIWWGGSSQDVPAAPGVEGVVTLTGVLTDSVSAQPIPGFRVAAAGGSGDGEEVLAETTSASDGSFSLAVSTSNSFFRLLLESGASQLYVTSTAGVENAREGFAYDLGAVALEQGAAVSGVVTLPAAPAGMFPVNVQVVGAEDEFGTGAYDVAAPGSAVPWRVVVPAGEYDISFSDGSTFVEQWWQAAATRDAATALTLAAGQSLGGLDATLAFGANSISGRVVTAQGAPLSGVGVSASPVSTGPGTSTRYYSAVTDSAGRYTFGNVQPGAYRLQFSPPRGQGLSTFYGGATYETATILTIANEGSTNLTGIDVTIVAGATVIGTLPQAAASRVTNVAARVSGTMGLTYGWSAVAPDGTFRLTDLPAGTYRLQFTAGSFNEVWGDPFTVAAGDQLTLDVSAYNLEFGTVAVTLDEALSARPGYIEVLDAQTRTVAATLGTYTSTLEVRVRPGDYLVRYTSYAGGQPVYYGGPSAATATVLTVAADERVPVFLSGGSSTISGVITDADGGAPLDDITVRLYRANDTGATSSAIGTATTDEDGVYTFAALSVDNYAVQAVGDTQLYVNRWFGPSGSREDATAISLGAGDTYDSADLALTLGGSIAGTFPEAVGAGYTYLSLWVQPTQGGPSLTFSGNASTMLDDSAFDLRGIPAGEYTIAGSLGGNSIVPTSAIVVVAGETTSGITLALPPAQIIGTVTSAITGQPVGAYVRATWEYETEWGTWQNSQSATADSTTGAYRLSGIPAGASVILKFERNYASGTLSSQWWQGAQTEDDATPIEIGPDGSAPFVANAVLQPGLRVTGRLVDALTGAGVAGVFVGDGNTSATSGSDGRFTAVFDRLGSTVLHTWATQDYVPSTTPLVIPDTGLDGVEISLQRGYGISGTVAAANNGVPLSNVSVSITGADDEYDYRQSVQTNADGTFTVPALLPGRYKVKLVNYDGLYVSQWYDGSASFDGARVVDIVDAPVTNIDARLGLGGTVSGRIVDTNGQPLAGATVGVATAPTNGIAGFFQRVVSLFAGPATTSPILGIETTTDADGRFVLPPLEPGDYTLYVYSPSTGTTWYNGKSTRAEADVIHVGAGQRVALTDDVEMLPIDEGETPRSPEETLSDAFDIVTGPNSQSVEAGQTVTFSALASGTPVPSVQWQRRDAGSNAWTDIEGESSRSLTFSAALADDGAAFRAVFALGDQTRETDAATLTVVPAPTAPAAPAAPTVSQVSTASATVTWGAPADGGRAIEGYEVAVYAAGAQVPLRTITLGAVTTATLGLDAATSYEVAVAARNAIGTGAWSPRAAVTTASFTAPDAPTDIVATSVTASSFVVQWKGATATPSAPVTGHRVVVTHGGDVVKDVTLAMGTTSLLVDGLQPQTLYVVSVASVNGIGQTIGAFIDATTAALPPAATVPGAPTALAQRSATPTGLSIGWQAPASDGGAQLTGYLVRVALGDAVTTLTVDASITEISVGELAPATDYSITVTAMNSVGAGPASSALIARTADAPVALPGVPRQVSAVATSATAAQVSWQAPASDGGAAISAYDVVITRGGQSAPAQVVVTGTTAIVSGLLPDTSYAVTVAARNSAGTGEASPQVTFTTPATVPTATAPSAPGAPRLVASTARTVSLTWDAPSSDGGSPITEYRVRVFGGTQEGAVVPAESTALTVANLIPDTEYVFTVEALNMVGVSPASGFSEVITTAADDVTLPPTEGNPGAGGGSVPAESSLTAQNRGSVTLAADRAAAGSRVGVAGLPAGGTYDVWFFSTPVSGGSVTADAAGRATVTVPASLPAGAHRVVFVDAQTGSIVGWVSFTVAGLPATGTSAPTMLATTAGALMLLGALLVVDARRRRRTTTR
ncbi:fibronectin type III domain-containing protein [Microbacterium binotii]|uniref:fibronectin type III domain-containing protein n=1 Tax=Microbacterium binotii TaxID=462710 RepID=UPI0031D4BF40